MFYPIRHFLLYFVPGSGLALLLGTMAMGNAPGLAPLVLLTLGFAAFALAVGRAASPQNCMGGHGRTHIVEALLELRRRRVRYAAIFAVVGTSLTAIALMSITAAGLVPPLAATLKVFFQVLAILFVVAWLLIGEAACSHAAIRRALMAHRDSNEREML